MPFIDKCKILIQAGNGGNGIVSWRREAHVPMGGPAGGNGGRGGNIYFVGDRNETSLETLAYKKKIIAQNGENGGIKNMTGRDADDVYVKVPLGTILINTETKEIIADILEDKKQYLVARGGVGGHGNAFFKSSFNKAPTLYENGELGQNFIVDVELKQISDIGLIGLPNAGKSSIISVLTNARPKIANYPFTTLNPVLGVLEVNGDKLVIADIPGLIEGASSGTGLGHYFLRHIERCAFLVHVVSLVKDENLDIVNSIKTINNELSSYSSKLLDKEMIIVANKTDEVENSDQIKLIKKNFPNTKIIATSCLTNEGIDELRDELIKIYQSLKLKNKVSNEQIIWTNKYDSEKYCETLSKEIKIQKINDHYFDVKCDYLKYWTHRIPLKTPDNLIRLNQKIAQTTMLDDLKKYGAKEGDTIQIYDITMNYEE